MRLNRFLENSKNREAFPNMAKLFESSNAEKRSLLQSYLKSGEVAAECETTLEVEKELENSFQGDEELLTIEGMRKAGISEHHVCYLFGTLFDFGSGLCGVYVCLSYL